MHAYTARQAEIVSNTFQRKYTFVFVKSILYPFFRTICFLSNGIMMENITIIMTPAVIIDTLNPIGIGNSKPQENTAIIPIKAKVRSNLLDI
ncbi:hypothetical protein BALH_4241 [Bacillus thuringiensis str. Al Hakam]|nr:hypothetical protein BALH_4241 [Bacillus thuringiensis str. Al Hakam]